MKAAFTLLGYIVAIVLWFLLPWISGDQGLINSPDPVTRISALIAWFLLGAALAWSLLSGWWKDQRKRRAN